jgi:hypothetical protein
LLAHQIFVIEQAEPALINAVADGGDDTRRSLLDGPQASLARFSQRPKVLFFLR